MPEARPVPLNFSLRLPPLSALFRFHTFIAFSSSVMSSSAFSTTAGAGGAVGPITGTVHQQDRRQEGKNNN